MAKSIFVLGSGHPQKLSGAVNLGDSAQFIQGLSVLRRLFPSSKIFVLSNSSKEEGIDSDVGFRTEVTDSLGIGCKNKLGRFFSPFIMTAMLVDSFLMRLGSRPMFSNRSLKNLLIDFSQSQFLFITGAGAINQKYLRGPAGLWVFTAFVSRILRVPVVAVGQQVGPLDDRFLMRLLIKAAFGRALAFGCRDYESVEVMKRMGVDESVVFFSGDEGAYLAPIDNLDAESELGRMKTPDSFLAVHFRLDSNCLFSDKIEEYAQNIAYVSKSLGVPILFIPMAYHGDNDDRNAIKKLASCLDVPSYSINCEDPATLKKHLLKARGAIGVANHFVVFCASVGVPTLAVYSTPYMKQKLLGAEKAYSYVKAIDVNDIGKVDFIELLDEARSKVGDFDKYAFQRHPPDYWEWLNRLSAVGVTANRESIRE